MYTVSLTVTEDKGATNTATTTCTVTQSNRPPTTPRITRPFHGMKSIDYAFTVVSTDADNDSLRYSVHWGDETSFETISPWTPSGTTFTCEHHWKFPVVYLITVQAFDNSTLSESASSTILIDVTYIEYVGYLIDQDGVGVYDRFYSNSTGNTIIVERQANGTYLIDTEGMAALTIGLT